MPKFSDLVKAIKMDAQVYVRRIPISSIPVDDEKKCGLFLYKLYEEKDEIFDVFHRTGSFDSLGVKQQDFKMNRYDLYNAIFWILVILVPTFYYIVVNVVWNGTWTLKITLLISVILGNRMIITIYEFSLFCIYNIYIV